MQNAVRFKSVDALRGLTVAAMLMVNNAGDWDHVYSWIDHSAWHGCTPADFIFPFFLFIVGVSLQLALAPQLERGVSPSILSKTVLTRGMRIILLGIVLHLIAMVLIEGRQFRLMGVLQRIGICFSLVGMLVIFLRNAKLQWILFGLILLAYSAVLIAGGSFEPNLNLVDKLDTLLLGKLAYTFDPLTGLAHEPEGILSTIPSIASVILGVRAGAMLRSGQVQSLWQIGVGMMLLTYLLLAFFPDSMPINKQLWTPTFVLWTGGFGLICLSLTHRLIDLRGFPPIGISFGVNAIAAYGGSWVATCLLAWSGLMDPVYKHVFAGPLVPWFGEFFASFAFAASFTGIFAGLMWYLRKRGWRFSI